VTERVSLPPRPADGGGLPKTEADLTDRLAKASDIVLEATLERAIQSEGRLRSQLDFIQMQIRVAQAEKASRRGLDLTHSQNGA
jgi:hypothetical protein